jgi:TPR repeat protein
MSSMIESGLVMLIHRSFVITIFTFISFVAIAADNSTQDSKKDISTDSHHHSGSKAIAEDCQPDAVGAKEQKDTNKTENIECPPAPDPYARAYELGRLSFWFKDYKNALEAWEPIANEGYAKAQTSMGWMYQNGLGVDQDYKQATEWYEKAVAQDFYIAQTNLGLMYETGLGLEKDLHKAVDLYQRASDQDYKFAHYNLGILYLDGRGVKKDKDKAITLFKKAHELGVEAAADALDSLGIKVEKKKKKDTHSLPVE